jgi:hypothetical protein
MTTRSRDHSAELDGAAGDRQLRIEQLRSGRRSSYIAAVLAEQYREVGVFLSQGNGPEQ